MEDSRSEMELSSDSLANGNVNGDSLRGETSDHVVEKQDAKEVGSSRSVEDRMY